MFRIRFAVALFAGAVALSPLFAQSAGESQAVLDLIDRADALSTQRHYQQALDAYREADRMSNHNCADCLLGMVNMECQLGDFSTALDDAKRAETAARTDRIVAAQACETRARLLVSTANGSEADRIRDAESELRMALSLDPKKSSARYELGMLLLAVGRDSEGVAELKSYVSGPLASPRYVDRANRLIADPSRARALPSEDFSVSTLGGGTVSKASLRGKVVLLDFWASWCGPCRQSLPAVVDLHQKFANAAFEIVGISADIDEDTWKQFVAEHHMSWPEAIDLDGQMARLFDVPGFPTYVLLDRDGAIAFRQTGFGPDSEINMVSAINRALAKPLSGNPAPSVASAASPTPSAALATSAPPAPPRSIRVNFVNPPDEVQNGDVRANVYRNDFLGLACKFPSSWTAADPEILDQLNRDKMRRIERSERVRPRSEPLPDDTIEVLFPEILFHAGSDPRFGPPFVEITVEQGGGLTLESALKEADALKLQGLLIPVPPRELAIGGHKFYRTDMDSAQSDPPVWMISLETLVTKQYLVRLTIQANSKKEIDDLASIAQSLTISKP